MPDPLAPPPDTAGGVVRAVIDTNKKDADGRPLVQVAFKDNVSSEDVESCYETGKVTGVHFDSDNHATLDYETVCNTVGTKTNVEKVPPVFVPKAEASGIKPGENLLALVAEGSHEGLVVRSTAAQKPAADGEKQGKTPVLQVRGQRFAAKTK